MAAEEDPLIFSDFSIKIIHEQTEKLSNNKGKEYTSKRRNTQIR